MSIYRVSCNILNENFRDEIEKSIESWLGEIKKENVMQLSNNEWLISYFGHGQSLIKRFEDMSVEGKIEIFASEIFQDHIAWHMTGEREKEYIQWLGNPQHFLRSISHIKSPECNLLS